METQLILLLIAAVVAVHGFHLQSNPNVIRQVCATRSCGAGQYCRAHQDCDACSPRAICVRGTGQQGGTFTGAGNSFGQAGGWAASQGSGWTSGMGTGLNRIWGTGVGTGNQLNAGWGNGLGSQGLRFGGTSQRWGV